MAYTKLVMISLVQLGRELNTLPLDLNQRETLLVKWVPQVSWQPEWHRGCHGNRHLSPTQVPSWINSSSPSAAYIRWWTVSSLVQIMACRLFGTKPLPEPMLTYCQLDSWEQISVKFESEFCHFHSRKFIWKCCLPKRRPFFQREMS